MGASMVSRDYQFSTAEFGGPHSDAIDGFSAIAAALDHGIEAVETNGNKFADAVAIGLGWLVLAAIIFYPTLQLAAIVACVAFMCMRSFIRVVFGAAVSSPAWPSGSSRQQQRSYLTA
jgi:hypothetical protein